MAGISNRALNGVLANKKKFNGIEHTTDLDLNQYDAFYRNADPKIGRWWQIDPKPNMAESPYAMMVNNPVKNVDPLGDTATVKWRSGFLGLGRRHEARHVGGQWIDAKSRNAINIGGVSRKGAQRVMNDYTKLNGIKAYKPVTTAINNATNNINLSWKAGPLGGPATDTKKYFTDLLGNGVANPSVNVYTGGRESSPKQLFENGNNDTPSYILLGHELGHVWDILNSGTNISNFTQIPGLAPGISRSEVNAMFWENVLRNDAGMDFRLWYHYDQSASPQYQLRANLNYVPVPFLSIVTTIFDLNGTNTQIRW